MKKVGVILSGCGVFDGAEIHESVLTLLALDKANAQAICAAPNIPQHHVLNHLTQKESVGESRNVLVEAARLARGSILPLDKLQADQIDAAIVPGGFGAAKNLCDFAFRGAAFSVLPELAQLLRALHQAGKPLGFICIAPAIAASLFGGEGVQFTIGSDPGTAEALEKNGAKHTRCAVTEIVIDRRLKIVTTPAYMLARSISEAEAGISKLVRAVLDMA
ncbi:MAG TPA: isoprenoid biosynthesis glyoxalase ElbB [Candidatus Paceibacterota bacterium]|nr:isoprenoid biosynthesis glyoxalase ElbB [Verrucomicrobiota bacterium]HRY49283.1 isoprenoid biosynthesis glyoxalase ElbB [Candidatus Paceibacterota bacterium]HRZ99592.1 isoprenoid biosynthesis glyoxalase ElbB [Candidatus Paceibacterota bacterium]